MYMKLISGKGLALVCCFLIALLNFSPITFFETRKFALLNLCYEIDGLLST